MKPADELKTERELRLSHEKKRRISELEKEYRDLIDEIYSEIEEYGYCVIMSDGSYIYGMDGHAHTAILSVFQHYGYLEKTTAEKTLDGGYTVSCTISIP